MHRSIRRLLNPVYTRFYSTMASNSNGVGKILLQEHLHFNNTATTLPLDKELSNFPRSPVKNAIFSIVEPTPVEKPVMVASSKPALALLGLPADLDEKALTSLTEYFAGNLPIPGARPMAHCYCGHQFGHFSGQLGDGATMYVGEVDNKEEEHWELQFKGAGKTPYSRTADGRKVLRSSIREFLASEAMHGLHIPTTRAGTIITSDTKVMRDIMYNGNTIMERASIITRIAPTFFRFGSFELAKTRDSITGREGSDPGNIVLIQKLLDFVISHYYKDLMKIENLEERYMTFLIEIIRRTAELVAQWDCVGWCHGVLNTDNMSIIGLTIDYGPFGFMEAFDPDYVCNSSDTEGRYSYQNQMEMVRWNCNKLTEQLKPLLGSTYEQMNMMERFDNVYLAKYHEIMRNKLGLLADDGKHDHELIVKLTETMTLSGADFTNTFRALATLPCKSTAEDRAALLKVIMKQTASLEAVLASKKPSVPLQRLQMLRSILTSNPDYAAQAGLTNEVLIGEEQRWVIYEKWLKLTQQEKEEQDRKAWMTWIDLYSERLQLETDEKKHVTVMNTTNPKYILRNWIAQEAITHAEQGDYSYVQKLERLLSTPFDDTNITHAKDVEKYTQKQRDASGAICVS